MNILFLILIFGYLIYFIVYVIRIFCFISKNSLDGYGYKNNIVIDIENVPIFRDIPCNGDIYYAYILIKLNNFEYDESNLLQAIILKWVRDKKVTFRDTNSLEKNKVIVLIKNSNFDNEFECKLFNMMWEASNNGILETKEFYEWAKNYDMRFLGLFAKMETEIINKLKKETHIYHKITEEECVYDYVMNDKMYIDSVELYGFKKYLETFSLMDSKEIASLHLWEEYLIFASLFGISDRISNQLKDLHPNIEELDMYNLL